MTNEQQKYSYDDITVTEIKALLDGLGVSYTSDMKKPELFGLLQGE